MRRRTRILLYILLGLLVLGGIGVGAWLIGRWRVTTALERSVTSDQTPSGDRTVSGWYFGSQLWSGNVRVTGDVKVLGDLAFAPGTRVLFDAGDDRAVGDELPPDGYNDHDPTRLASYTTTHSEIIVLGRLLSRGTSERPVVITSSSTNPDYADWQSIVFFGNGSLVEHTQLSWSRNGLIPQGEHSSSAIRNSEFRHNFWSGISGSTSSITAENNIIMDCGHEGIDIQGGASRAVIRGNTIGDCHAGIVILGGQPLVENNWIRAVGDGIHVEPKAAPVMRNNTIELAPEGSTREWRYGTFAYQLFGDPIKD